MIPVTAEEVALMLELAARFGPEAGQFLREGDATLWKREDGATFLVPPALRPAVEQGKLEPLAAGVHVARLRGLKVEWTLEGAALLAKRATRGVATIRPKAAQLFLYGRHVLSESIESLDRSVGPGGVVLVVTRDGDSLGLARVEAPGSRTALAPLLDRGWYLREGG